MGHADGICLTCTDSAMGTPPRLRGDPWRGYGDALEIRTMSLLALFFFFLLECWGLSFVAQWIGGGNLLLALLLKTVLAMSGVRWRLATLQRTLAQNPERLVFGTDMSYEEGVGKILAADLTDEQREDVWWRNMRGLLDRRRL